MAYTITIDKTVVGNKRCHSLKVLADAASANVNTGLQHIDFVTLAPITMTTVGVRFRPNLTGAGVASEGTLGISGCTAGDEFFVTVFGR